MKKILVSLALVAGLFGACRADELASIFDVNRKVHYENATVTTSTQIIFIDLSDTVNYPHERTGSVGISKITTSFISNLGAANISSGTIQLGVVTYVGNSTGTVKWFATYPYFTTSSATVSYNDFLAPIYTRSAVRPIANSDGTTPYFASNNTTSGSSIYTSTLTVLPTSLGGNVNPGLGDIILNLNIGTGSIIRFVMDVYYAGVKP